MAQNGRETGTVKKWMDDKGFGFITCEKGKKDVFVHFSQIVMHGRKTLEPGQVVEFTVVETEKGPQANDVEVLSDYRLAENLQREKEP